MNLRNLRYGRVNSSLGRSILRLFFRPGRTYKIMCGPLRGRRMFYDRSVNFHAVLGLWEPDVFDLLTRVFVKRRILSNEGVIADIGANLGYYTMWLATTVVGKGIVYAFEPSPETLEILSTNLAINNITNATIVGAACGDHVGQTDFFIAKHHHSSSLHADWASGGIGEARRITVPMTTLDEFFGPKEGRRPPNFIKIDIEGGATYAFQGCQRILRETRPYILIESHTPKEDRAISQMLNEFRYGAYRLNDSRWVRKPHAIHPDADGVWGTLLLTPEERCEPISAVVGSPICP
jgi:FkbM family methyltransferase